MVRAFVVFLMVPIALFAGEFTASVSKNRVSLGESFQLNLSLKDVSAKGGPALAPLKDSFSIYSQQQSSNTVIINGKMSSGVTWQLTLLPLKEGELTIPPITIDTAEGALTSKAVTIHVVKGNEGGGGASQGMGLTLTANVSNAAPYKSEPFTYTVKLIAKEPIAKVSMQKFSVDDAIVEQIGEPKSEEKIVDGIKVAIVSFNYLITPLKPGSLKIPATIVQGGIASKKKSRLGSFFDEDFDSFSMMRGFQILEPFALATDEIAVVVKPQVAGVTPWLPARGVVVEDSWDNTQTPQVGEPLTRTLKISAVGVSASQLPGFSEAQVAASTFKVYADNPQTKEEMKNGEITSERTEQYTLIPQKAGKVEVPEIKVAWWNVAKQKEEYTKVSAKTFDVKSASHEVKSEAFSEPLPALPKEAALPSPPAYTQRDPLLYAFVAILGALLAAAIFWSLMLQRKIARLSCELKRPLEKPKDPISKPGLKELDLVKDPQELRQFLQSYCQSFWGLPKNAEMKTVFDEIRRRSPDHLKGEIDALEKMLQDALYRGREVRVQETAKSLKSILAEAKEAKHQVKANEKLPDLNPT